MSYKDRFKKQLRDLSIYNDIKVRDHGTHFDSDRNRIPWDGAYNKRSQPSVKKDTGSERE